MAMTTVSCPTEIDTEILLYILAGICILLLLYILYIRPSRNIFRNWIFLLDYRVAATTKLLLLLLLYFLVVAGNVFRLSYCAVRII